MLPLRNTAASFYIHSSAASEKRHIARPMRLIIAFVRLTARIARICRLFQSETAATPMAAAPPTEPMTTIIVFTVFLLMLLSSKIKVRIVWRKSGNFMRINANQKNRKTKVPDW